jgi:translation initiation factor IF-3
MSLSKFKYEQNKKKRETKHKPIEQKEMWFGVGIDEGDMQHKIKRIQEFLDKKHSVKLTIKARGRVSSSVITSLMQKILGLLQDSVAYDNNAKFEGRNYTAIVRPIKK